MHPFKNWELNESLEDLNDFTSGFTQIEVANLEIDNSEEKENNIKKTLEKEAKRLD